MAKLRTFYKVIRETGVVKGGVKTWNEIPRSVKHFVLVGGLGLGTYYVFNKFGDENPFKLHHPLSSLVTNLKLTNSSKSSIANIKAPSNQSASSLSSTVEDTFKVPHPSLTSTHQDTENAIMRESPRNADLRREGEKTSKHTASISEDVSGDNKNATDKEHSIFPQVRESISEIDSEEGVEEYIRPPRPKPKKGKKWKDTVWVDDSD